MARRPIQRRGQGAGRLIGVAVLAAAMAVALTLLVTQPRGGQGGLSGVADDVGGAIGSVVSAPVRWAQSGGSWIGSYFGGAKRIRALEAENAELVRWRDQAMAMSSRLDAYEQLHSVQSERMPAGVTGRMVAESAGPFSRAGIVNVGSGQGVKVNWIVFNQNGLVGRVISVGATSSRVLLLTDGDTKVPVMGEVTRARGILIGDKTAAPQLAHLNLPPVIGDNERLMTSGDDGMFPRGLAVGTAGKGPDGKWRIRLASARAPVDFVTLIPPSDFPPPADPVTAPVFTPVGEAPIATGGAASLPLAAGAAGVPTAATPEAIAQAQREGEAAREARRVADERARLLRQAQAERDAAREAQRRAEADAARATEREVAPAAEGPAPPPVPVPVPVPLDNGAPKEGGT